MVKEIADMERTPRAREKTRRRDFDAHLDPWQSNGEDRQ
jgi:hypothetical protein